MSVVPSYDERWLAAPNTPEWDSQRLTGIGASEAAAAAGLSEWSTPLDVFASKLQLIPPTPPNDAMRMGHLLEPVVQAVFCERENYDILVSPCGLMRHASEDFVLATPDAIVSSGCGFELGEWKTTTWRMAQRLGEEQTDEVPIDWLCQVQQQMAVTGHDICNIAVLLDGRTLKTYRVEREDTLIEALIEAERELWRRIQENDPPEPDWQHPHTADLIRKMYRRVEGEVIDLDGETAEHWLLYEGLSADAKKIKAQADDCKARVLYAIGDRGGGRLPDGRIVRRKVIAEREVVASIRKSYIDVRVVKGDR